MERLREHLTEYPRELRMEHVQEHAAGTPRAHTCLRRSCRAGQNLRAPLSSFFPVTDISPEITKRYALIYIVLHPYIFNFVLIMSTKKMPHRKDAQLNLRIDQETLDRIANVAVDGYCSRTELIRRWIMAGLEQAEGKAQDPVSAYLDRVSAYLNNRHKPFYPRYGFSEQSRTSPYLKNDGENDRKNDGMETGEDADEMEKELQKLAGIINRLIADGLIDVGCKQNQR